MKIALCDDLVSDKNNVKNLFAQVGEQLGLSLQLECFSCGEELIAAAEKDGEFSLAVLDIYMSGLNGIETARRIRQLIPDIKIAFITASSDFTLDAFELNAVHYLQKPVNYDKVYELIKRFYERIHDPVRTISINWQDKVYSFPAFHIQKIVSEKRGVDIFLSGQKEPSHIPVPFMDVERQLDSSLFLKVSRGMIVKMSFVMYLGNGVCKLRDGTDILVSRKDKNEIQNRYNDYLFMSMGAEQ